jgi:hypothetical protein
MAYHSKFREIRRSLSNSDGKKVQKYRCKRIPAEFRTDGILWTRICTVLRNKNELYTKGDNRYLINCLLQAILPNFFNY